MSCVFCDTDTQPFLKPSAVKMLIDTIKCDRHNSLSHLKPIPHFIPMLSNVMEPPRLRNKFVLP